MEIRCPSDDELINNQHISRESYTDKSPAKRDTQKSFAHLSYAEHLKEAKNALADGYKIDTNPIKSVWGRLNDAKRHLTAIDPQASQYDAAQKLAEEVLLRQRHMKNAYANVVHRHMIKQRQTLANDLEQYFVNKGIYAEIEVNGIDKSSLKVSCSALRVASINKIADETNFFSHLKKVGFTCIIFENNSGKVKIYKLETQ